MKINLLFILLFMSFISQVKAQTQTCFENLDHPNLETIFQVVDSDTIFREYILNIPSNYDDATSTPLIINMHGFGDCASEYSKTIGDFYNFKQLAEQENIIVVYPQGAYRPEKEDTYWEPGDNGVDNIYENDVYFIDELIANLQADYNIDPAMIYVCGYSNGGMMSYSLACNRSNLFSAIGIMSGTMLEENCSLDSPIPIIKFHGIADEVLPYNGSIWYQSVADVVSYWLEQNNIPTSSLASSELNDGKVILDDYSGGDENSCLRLYTINEEYDKPGDHVWFSDEIDGITPNEIMWNFFKGNCSTVNNTNDPNELQIEVFPNPFQEEVNVKDAMNSNYTISDINGKIMLTGKIMSENESIDLKHLEAGSYIINVDNNFNKIIKRH